MKQLQKRIICILKNDSIIDSKEKEKLQDVKGEYPTLVIKHNISHDTLNCKCCCDDDSAYLEPRLMELTIHCLKR